MINANRDKQIHHLIQAEVDLTEHRLLKLTDPVYAL